MAHRPGEAACRVLQYVSCRRNVGHPIAAGALGSAPVLQAHQISVLMGRGFDRRREVGIEPLQHLSVPRVLRRDSDDKAE